MMMCGGWYFPDLSASLLFCQNAAYAEIKTPILFFIPLSKDRWGDQQHLDEPFFTWLT